eukprot:scaffold625_cov420-Prasinococcus_capsulatus_cf.AAC.20
MAWPIATFGSEEVRGIQGCCPGFQVEAAITSVNVAKLKWHVVKSILASGVSVLVIEPDTVLIQDPFQFLYRDSDVEGATDGWDDTSAYGYDHVVDDPDMGWSRFMHGTRVASQDPGASAADSEEVKIFVEEVSLPSHGRLHVAPWCRSCETCTIHCTYQGVSSGTYVAPGVTRRAMNYLCFANSKVVFRYLRHQKNYDNFTPVVVRLTFHSSKAERMSSIVDRYIKQNTKALNAWTTDVGPKSSLNSGCAEHIQATRDSIRYSAPRVRGQSATDALMHQLTLRTRILCGCTVVKVPLQASLWGLCGRGVELSPSNLRIWGA